jgi:hypothetical protein
MITSVCDAESRCPISGKAQLNAGKENLEEDVQKMRLWALSPLTS